MHSDSVRPFLSRLDTLSLPASTSEWPAEMLMRAAGDWATYYAPFDHINHSARVAIVGITPGLQQATNAMLDYRFARERGAPSDAALEIAKEAASFSGPMRTNLVSMLDHIGLARWLGISSCADLFTARTDLAHFTSVLRYPVTFRGQNYSGTPAILTHPFTRREFEEWFAPETAALPDAVWIPLGPAVTKAVESLIAPDQLSERRILSGLPHPSPSNIERIKYFVGEKARADLSIKTDPDKLDAARSRLFTQIASLGAYP